MKDIPLLQQFARENSEEAFRQLVERHLSLVHSAALRQVRDASLAQDVTQAVFLILARKARKISANTILSGWLYRTTHFVATKALRSELRRKHHEQEAAQMQNTQFAVPDRTWEKLVPLLDDAMLQLNEKDRSAILLRYFENKDLTSVGHALGTSDDAAQKRVSRALDKLRRVFSKRGIVLPSLALGNTLAACATEAAPSLPVAEMIVGNCLNKSVVAPGIYALVQESVRQLFWINFARISGATALFLVCAFFFVENFPTQMKVKEIEGRFGMENNSGAPKKKPVARRIEPPPERTIASVEPIRVAQIEAPVLIVAPPAPPKLQVTNAPILPLIPPAPLASTASSRPVRYVASGYPQIAQTNFEFALSGFSTAPTNERPRSLPVFSPRQLKKPVVTRNRPQRKTQPNSNRGGTDERSLF